MAEVDGYIVKETKDFVPTASNKPRGKITINIAFWPQGSKDKMYEVLKNMALEKPESLFDIFYKGTKLS